LNSRQKTGRLGEEQAVQILRAKGYKIINRNFSTRYGELDIVAMDGDCLVFVEVKARFTKAYGDGLESITYKKRQHLGRVALTYLMRHGIRDYSCRFDVIALELGRRGEVLRCTHITGAFGIEGGNYY
jgi:putative endonuclease